MNRYAVILGANLNTLGSRDPRLYGELSVSQISALLQDKAVEIGCEVELVQSNSEAELIEWTQARAENLAGILVNPGGFTRFGQPLCDAIVDVGCPWIEVHMSNIHARGIPSIWSGFATGQVSGFKWHGYVGALLMLHGLLTSEDQSLAPPSAHA
jgi:3-dehydroquinate dehydratase-2